MQKQKNILRATREKSGKTQLQVATEVGMDVHSYQRYEYGTGNKTIRTAIRIAHALGSNVESLWDGNPVG